jgi:hypothetical protein
MVVNGSRKAGTVRLQRVEGENSTTMSNNPVSVRIGGAVNSEETTKNTEYVSICGVVAFYCIFRRLLEGNTADFAAIPRTGGLEAIVSRCLTRILTVPYSRPQASPSGPSFPHSEARN